MPKVARKGDKTECPEHELLIIPHVGGPLRNAQWICLQADGKPVIRLGDYADCMFPAPDDVVAEGAATFTVCGLPVARKGDHMIHGGLIIEGSAHFEVGGPTFSIAANIAIHGPASFQNAVVRDIFFLSNTRTGREILLGIEASGQPVEIVPSADPHNSFATPADVGNATNGTGTGSTVEYNPDAATRIQDSSGAWHPQPPQVLFGHELTHAYHNAKGTNVTNTPDPNAPASHPGIPSEEAQTIGTGSYNDAFPSENSLRKDLRLPRRDNWWIKNEDDSGNELTAPTANMRPGSCT